jgi:hypothetical protein
MRPQRLGGIALLLVLLVSLAIPSVSADQGTVYLDDGETYSKNITMAQGHTMYVKYDSSDPLTFMVVDPNGNIIKHANSTYVGYFIDAQVSGDYALVWQCDSPASTSLSYDYNADVIGLNSLVVQVIIVLVVVVVVVALVMLFRRRKK